MRGGGVHLSTEHLLGEGVPTPQATSISPRSKLDPKAKRDSRPLQTRPSHRRCHRRRHGQSGPDLTSPITTASLASAASTSAPDSLHLEHSYGSRRLHNDLHGLLLLQGEEPEAAAMIRAFCGSLSMPLSSEKHGSSPPFSRSRRCNIFVHEPRARGAQR